MPRILGTVPFLNARPLTASLRGDFEVREAPPSRLAERLRAGEFEAALLPIVDAFRLPGARVVPGLALGARGDVLSVRIFCDLPFADVRTVARDPASHTSNALLEILAARFWKRPLPPGASSPARLVIGDAALKALGKWHEEVDLAGAWLAWTGLPFVFAAWVTLAPRPGLAAALAAAAKEGLARRDAIADAEAKRLELDPALCRRYLRENMRFTLGEEELAGVERFRREAVEMKLVPANARLAIL